MSLTSPTRRETSFAPATLAGAWIAMGLPALSIAACDAREAFEAGLPLQNLDEQEAATLDALDRGHLPDDRIRRERAKLESCTSSTRCLGSIMEGAGDFVRDGLAEVHAQTVEAHGAALEELDRGRRLISAVTAVEDAAGQLLRDRAVFGVLRRLRASEVGRQSGPSRMAPRRNRPPTIVPTSVRLLRPGGPRRPGGFMNRRAAAPLRRVQACAVLRHA